ncbi:MAG: hypothetical protein GY838_05105 [bacterium]|nr:hypothetical protein [bacterium]
MKTRRASIIGLLTIIIAGSAAFEEARAEILVKATVTTPQVRLHLSNAPAGHNRYVARDRGSYRHRIRRHVSRIDRAMAKRLARVTGIPRRELLDQRRFGYTWREIGRWYDLPRPMIRAASDHRSWKRWLQRDRMQNRRGRVACRYDRRSEFHDR